MRTHASTVLHIGDPACTATLISGAARMQGMHWPVIQLATRNAEVPKFLSPLSFAMRGALFSAHVARTRATSNFVHLHSALAMRHVSWTLRPHFALHLHGTDIRTRLYEPEHTARVTEAVRRASAVFYSTPDLAEHARPLRADAVLVPVPVLSPAKTEVDQLPAAVRSITKDAPYVLFTSRWDDSKGGLRQISVAKAVSAAVKASFPDIKVLGLDWGPYAQEARSAGVTLLPKLPVSDFRRTAANARVGVGQLSGILAASELEALAADVPLVAPLNPSWYDSSHSSLIEPPVEGGRDITPQVEADLIPSLVCEQLASSEERGNLRSAWIRDHHSPEKALETVLETYRTTGLMP